MYTLFALQNVGSLVFQVWNYASQRNYTRIFAIFCWLATLYNWLLAIFFSCIICLSRKNKSYVQCLRKMRQITALPKFLQLVVHSLEHRCGLLFRNLKVHWFQQQTNETRAVFFACKYNVLETFLLSAIFDQREELQLTSGDVFCHPQKRNARQ